MKRDAAYFQEGGSELIYVARRLKDALRLESILTAAGVDYGVEADTYHGGFLFQSERVGAFFYVLPSAAESTRQVLRENGYRPHQPKPDAKG